jgi:hypothetical protein
VDASRLAGYRKLLAAVIVQAIADACEPPICPRLTQPTRKLTPQQVAKLQRQRHREACAVDAVRWLMDPLSACSRYAGLIGWDADALRERLLLASRSGRRCWLGDGAPLDLRRFRRRLRAMQTKQDTGGEHV